jgi:hypothetical protein
MRALWMMSLVLALCWAPAVRAEEATALIWRGAKTEAEAKAHRPAWKNLRELLFDGGIWIEDEFPKLTRSDTVTGLKPGFWVWIVGYCARDESAKVLELLKKASPETYARDVEVPVAREYLKCPFIRSATLEVSPHRFELDGGRVLRVFTHSMSRDPGDDTTPVDTMVRTYYVFVLMNKAGNVLDKKTVVGKERFKAFPGNANYAYTCTEPRITPKGTGTVEFTRQCTESTAECGAREAWDEVTTIAVSGNTVTAREVSVNEKLRQCGAK